MPEKPLSLAEIDAFDPGGPTHRKWCPLCGGDKPKDAAHRCLSVERQNGLWHCFRCGQSGQATEFWRDKTAISGRETARRALKSAFSLPPVSSLPNSQTPANLGSWQEKWKATAPLGETPGANYLLRRGIALQVSAWADVSWSRDWCRGGAVVFPLCSREGKVVAAQARSVCGEAKLTSSPKKEGAFAAPIRLGERVFSPLDGATPSLLLTEAPLDALSLAGCGFPALALCGTSGPSWLHLACGFRRVLLALDADDAGDQASEKLRVHLTSFGARCLRLRPEGGKDWNQILQEQGGEAVTEQIQPLFL